MKESGRSATQMEQPEARSGEFLDEPSDAALGAALSRGDESALASLYDRHLPAIYDYLARYLRDPSAAEDLAQITFVRAWERRETLREPDGVRAWLFRIAHNLGTNQLVRSRRAEPIEERFDLAAPGPGPEQEALTREAAELVWSAASSLEPRQYEILDLCIRRELSTREVAEVMEMPVSHAAVLVNRAREALGNAVRYLLVAKRREHCERLAALVPAGVRALTPELRSAVDHHMRRCEDCRNLGRRLTSPAELFGGLVALPPPESLHGPGRDYVLTSARHLQRGSEQSFAGRSSLPSQRGVLAGLTLLLIGLLSLATALVIHRQTDAAPAGAPATVSPAAEPSGAPPTSSPGSPASQGPSAAAERPASGSLDPAAPPNAQPSAPPTAQPGTPSSAQPGTVAPITPPSTAPSAATSTPAITVQTPTQARGRLRVTPPPVSP
jgi:RNA polymerase sigma factor (sigma-70 family)